MSAIPQPLSLEEAIIDFVDGAGWDCMSDALRQLISRIRTEVTPEWVASLRLKGSVRLEEIAAQALNQPVVDRHGKPVAHWLGDYTLVQISRRGEIVAAATKPTTAQGQLGPVYRHYRNGLESAADLMPFAVAKAVIALYLDMTVRTGTALDPVNAGHLEDTLGRTYVGAYYDRQTDHVIGASGCEVGYSDRLGYAPGASHSGRHAADFLAGAFDEIFARLVAKPSLGSPEPDSLATLRRMH